MSDASIEGLCARATWTTVQAVRTYQDEGLPAAIEGTCPAQLLGGAATCEATANGAPTSVRVTLVDGMPTVEVL